MQFTTVVLAGFAALASAQTTASSASSSAYTGSIISPTAAAPSGCATTYSTPFELSVVNVTTTSSKAKRQASPNNLVITLKNGVLTDSQGRIGYVASNYQFQFNAGGQAGELYSAGFSVCANNTLALGGSAIFYECLSGNFYNLYDRSWAAQCSPIYLDIIPQSGSASATTTTASSTGAVAGTAVSKTTSSVAVASSITDGQPQAGSASATVSSVSVITSVKSSTTTAAVLSSITDNQIQAPTASSAVVSATTSLSTVTPKPSVSSTSVAIVSSISDNQIQAPTKASVTAYTGAAAMPTMAAQIVLAVAGAAVALL